MPARTIADAEAGTIAAVETTAEVETAAGAIPAGLEAAAADVARPNLRSAETKKGGSVGPAFSIS